MSDRLREALAHFLAASSLTRSDQPNTPYVKIMGPSVDDVETVLAAARRFLALAETGRRVEWCETHGRRARPNGWDCHAPLTNQTIPCRIVPKFLADLPDRGGDMSLRDDLIHRLAWYCGPSNAPDALDEVLDVLADRADEWADAEAAGTLLEERIPKVSEGTIRSLVAVLRGDT